MPTIQGAPAHRFFPITFHHSDELLCVVPNASNEKAIATASLWLAQSRDILGAIAEGQEGLNDAIYGAITLLELAKGLIDHIDVDFGEVHD